MSNQQKRALAFLAACGYPVARDAIAIVLVTTDGGAQNVVDALHRRGYVAGAGEKRQPGGATFETYQITESGVRRLAKVNR